MVSWVGAGALRAAMWIEADEEKGKIDMVEEVLSMANSYNQRIFILLLDIDSHIAHPVSRQSRLPPPRRFLFILSSFPYT